MSPLRPRGPQGVGADVREALRPGHNYVGTEHLLLALLEWEDGQGPLSDAGLDKAAVEAGLLAALDSSKAPPGA